MAYNLKPSDLDLKFDVNMVCEIERLTGQKIADIIDELQSETGSSLHVLRAIVAVGHIWRHPLAPALMSGMHVEMIIDEQHAGKLIQKIGVAKTAAHIGERLGGFLRTLSEAA